MKKFSKADEARRVGIRDRMREAIQDVNSTASKINDLIHEANEKIGVVNEVFEEARGFREDMVSEIDSYMEDRSEKWQDGDKGQQYQAWKDALEEFSPEDIEPFEEIEEFTDEQADELDNLPSSPDEF